MNLKQLIEATFTGREVSVFFVVHRCEASEHLFEGAEDEVILVPYGAQNLEFMERAFQALNELPYEELHLKTASDKDLYDSYIWTWKVSLLKNASVDAGVEGAFSNCSLAFGVEREGGGCNLFGRHVFHDGQTDLTFVGVF